MILSTASLGEPSGTMRIRLLRKVVIPGGIGAPGEVHDIPKGDARHLIYTQTAEEVDPTTPLTAAKKA